MLLSTNQPHPIPLTTESVLCYNPISAAAQPRSRLRPIFWSSATSPRIWWTPKFVWALRLPDTTKLTPDQYRLGGTVTFAAITAQRLGRRPSVVTRAAATTDLTAMGDGVDLVRLSSATSSTFANIYTPKGRVQYCFTPAPPITAGDIPARLRSPRIALMGPIAAEITPDVATVFGDDTLVAAIPQGWMRRWDADGRVHSKAWTERDAFLPHLDVLILSLEDIDGNLSHLAPFFAQVPLLILTEYRDGSTVYQRQADGTYAMTKVPASSGQRGGPHRSRGHLHHCLFAPLSRDR